VEEYVVWFSVGVVIVVVVVVVGFWFIVWLWLCWWFVVLLGGSSESVAFDECFYWGGSGYGTDASAYHSAVIPLAHVGIPISPDI